ncbi:MAG: hypothetical protein AAFO01_21630, partial [Pseudomonadota bacterium]
ESNLPSVDLPIVCVQLPTDSTADSSGGSLEPHLQLAIEHIFQCADLIAQEEGTGPIPVVINFSYGHHRGPHDGTGVQEAAINQRIIDRRAMSGVPCNVVLPVGNSHLTRTHAEIDFRRVGETRTLNWRVLPDDQSPSYVNIWLPRGTAASRFEVRVTFPNGETSLALNENTGLANTLDLTDMSGRQHGEIKYQFDPEAGRSVFQVTLNPTRRVVTVGGSMAQAGLWRLHLTNLGLNPDDIVNAWVDRDDTPIGFPIRGQQSYFDHKDYRVYDDNGRYIETDDPSCSVRRAGTISGIATGDETIVVGGYYRKPIYRIEDEQETYRLAEYSAGGPTNDAPNRAGPDAGAVSDDSRVHRGMLAAGTQSGSTVSLNGTSVAAPLVTRRIALEMADGVDVTRSTVQGWVEATDPPPPAGRPYPRWGHGRIETPPVRPQKRYEPWPP